MAIKATGAAQEVLAKIRELNSEFRKDSASPVTADKAASSKGFLDYLKDGVSDVNQMQKSADKMAIDLSSGKNDNIHETMLASTQAELSFNLMVQLRNRALEAYQEVMRMQV